MHALGTTEEKHFISWGGGILRGRAGNAGGKKGFWEKMFGTHWVWGTEGLTSPWEVWGRLHRQGAKLWHTLTLVLLPLCASTPTPTSSGHLDQPPKEKGRVEAANFLLHDIPESISEYNNDDNLSKCARFLSQEKWLIVILCENLFMKQKISWQTWHFISATFHTRVCVLHVKVQLEGIEGKHWTYSYFKLTQG